MASIGKISFLLCLAVLFLIGLTLRFEALDIVIFNEWIARDFDRAFNIVDGAYIPLAGPEVNNGGRLPGPFMYFFLTIPLLIKYSYNSIFAFNFVLNVSSIICLFFVLKKYFDIYVSGITAGLISINFLFITAVAFPVNPSFLFPFITAFIWLLLEFGLKENTKVVPYIALIFALAVQFHYSIASYFLIPVIIGLIFRIKVPLKTILASLILIAICISPYAIHKNKSFIPKNAGENITLTKQDFSSPWVNFKIISLLHTFNYLTELNTSVGGSPSLPKSLSTTLGVFTGISFYILFYIILNKYKNGNWRSCKKEIIVLITFWVPAFLYGIVNPMINHPWYGFIFIIPQALLLSIVITTIHRQLLYKRYKVIYSGLILFLIFNAGHLITLHTRSVFKGINNNTFSKDITSKTYKNTQLLLRVLSNELNLPANEFYDRVYLNGYHLYSKRRLKMLGIAPLETIKNMGAEDKLSCYFIFDKNLPRGLNSTQSGRIADVFFNDESINILSKRSLDLLPWGFSSILKIYRYQPIQNQSCYNNTFNPFTTTKSIRDFLIQAKEITFPEKEDVNYKVLKEEIKYDTNNDLQFLKTSYVINNKISQSPFQFDLSILKTKDGYSVRGSIELYSFFKAPNYDMKRMDILIKKPNINHPVNTLMPEAINSNNTVHILEILTPYTLANFLNINNTNLFNYNQKWYREVPTTISMKKGEFNISLKWTLNCGEYPSVSAYSRGVHCPLKPEKDFMITVYK